MNGKSYLLGPDDESKKFGSEVAVDYDKQDY